MEDNNHMIINLLCDNNKSWIIPYVNSIRERLLKLNYRVFFINSYEQIVEGELLFLLSCEKIMPQKYLGLNKHNLVIHESDLPKGKGWSPITWQILEGKNEITITLFEASTDVDSGKIYMKETIILNGSETLPKIKHQQGIFTEKLVLDFVKRYPNIKGIEQVGEESFYRKRTSEDSELDINKTIDDQFNLLRVVDNERYPAFFYKNNKKYVIKIYETDDK